MADEAHPAVSLPENLWPTTRAAVDAIDGLHRLTGLPWWATLTLTAVGEPPHRLTHVQAHEMQCCTPQVTCSILAPQVSGPHSCRCPSGRCRRRPPSGRSGGRRSRTSRRGTGPLPAAAQMRCAMSPRTACGRAQRPWQPLQTFRRLRQQQHACPPRSRSPSPANTPRLQPQPLGCEQAVLLGHLRMRLSTQGRLLRAPAPA